MSDHRNQAVVAAPEAERIVELGHRPSLIEASMASARSISQTMTGVIQPQIDAHSAQIGAAQGLIGTQGEAIAGNKALIDGHTALITAAQKQIGSHGEAIAGANTQLGAHTATIATIHEQIGTQGGAIAGNKALIDGHTTLITAAQKEIGTQGEVIAGNKALIDGHTTLITAAQKQIGSHGEAIAGANARLDAHHERLAGMQAHLTRLGETASRHDQAIAFALLGEDAQIQQLVRRVEWLEHNCRQCDVPSEGSASDQTREMREASDALRERVTSMEETIRQLLARGPDGGGPRRRT